MGCRITVLRLPRQCESSVLSTDGPIHRAAAGALALEGEHQREISGTCAATSAAVPLASSA